MNQNPFPITAYQGPEYFCNRSTETDALREALQNGRSTTLFSPRRMGKTGLIHHLFHTLKAEKCNTIYVDIFGTEDLNGFLNRLANASLDALSGNRDHFFKKAMEVFGRLRPQVSYNELTGVPQISFSLQNEGEKQATLTEILGILEKQKDPNYIAIDEFQQISQYPESNTEQILRSHFQHLKNCWFIYSGSQRHLLAPMFSDPSRAFYQSGGYLSLGSLDRAEYKAFIQDLFARNKKSIAEEAVEYILDWTRVYTFYTQYLCNKVYSKGHRTISREMVRECILEIFSERDAVFYNYRNLLTHAQFHLLAAIGRDESVMEPYSQDFIQKHHLSSVSTVRKSLQALVDKEMVYEITGEEKPVYQVYDVFLLRWLQSR